MKAFNDKNMLTDVLYHLKDLMTTCGTAIKESNCENMRSVLTSVSGKVADNQFALFQYMNEMGFYPIENVQDQKIQQTLDMHSCKK